VPVRAHGAERALAREQEALLLEWARAGRALLRTALATSGAQLVAGFGLAAWLLFSRARLGDEGGGALLLAYWALNIPVLGQEIAQVAWQYPTQRNLTLRLLEPLGALEEPEPAEERQQQRVSLGSSGIGAAIELRDVTVRAGGHTILDSASLTIPAGAHVAIVGASGAGKSTLLGLLLGWHRPASGLVMLDGKPLEAALLDELRLQTAWVDPSVQLWNRSLIENLEFGCGEATGLPLGTRIADAELRGLMEQLPEGLQTPLGESGTLVSGGEGQRVRFGRSLGRDDARLVLLDEPFRGLEREKRRLLLGRARDRWRNATLLCATHDMGETSGFDWVVVMAHGRVVEEGAPSVLAQQAESHYRSLLDAEADIHLRLWADPSWRTIRLEDGKIVDSATSRAERAVEALFGREDDSPRRDRVTG
jgi:ABC-type transport system involved in cytochrome bd biosynthesis fused ATPase/permease subunit